MTDALIYPGCVNAFAAEPATGKTMIALHACTQLIAKGEAVLYLDYEGNRRSIGDRLRSLGATPEQAPDFLYVRPNVVGPAERAALCGIVRDRGVRLAVIDGMAKSLAREGYSEDKAVDVLAWMDKLCWPLTGEGAAVLLLDHVVKNKDEQGRWARGSGAKLGELDGAAYALRGGKFSRTKAGTVRMVLTKDREGWVGTEGQTVALVQFTPAGERLMVKIERPEDAPENAAGVEAWMTERMDGLEVWLRSQPADETYSKNTLAGSVSGRREVTLKAIDALVALGRIEVTTYHGHEVYGLVRNEDEAEEDAELEF